MNRRYRPVVDLPVVFLVFLLPQCLIIVSGTMLDSEEKFILLYLHNNARRNLDIRVYDNVELLTPTKLLELEWNSNLEVIAQQVANGCEYETAEPEYTTEYESWLSKYSEPSQTLAGGTDVVGAFLNLYDNSAPYYIPSTDSCESGQSCTSFKQILSDQAEMIACARPDEAVCDKEYLFCMYYPPFLSNVETYTTGDTPCSDVTDSYTIDKNLCRNCDDEDPVECAKLKHENGGVCDDTLNASCPYICGLCDGGLQELSGSCLDSGEADCDDYVSSGYCEEDNEFYYLALEHCQYSCEFLCECRDTITKCKRLIRYCDVSRYALYMSIKCSGTCLYCDIELDLAYTSPG